jgi:hypothetical protein
MATLLSKMQLAGEASADGRTVSVQVPITRSDVLHGEAGRAGRAGEEGLGEV